MTNYTMLFPKTRNIHLVKEIGMIPYYLHRLYNYNSTILTEKHGEYPFLEEHVNGVKLEFTKKTNWLKFNPKIFIYLLKKSRKIDVLNLMHYKFKNVVYGLFYKVFNRNGILYLKTDASPLLRNQDLFLLFSNKGSSILSKTKNLIKIFLTKRFLQQLDIVSFESREMCNYFKSRYPEIREKIIYVPNGIDNWFLEKENRFLLEFKNKENILLTVGRIGTWIKSTETLLKAVSNIDLKGWKVVLIGRIKKDFNEYIDNYYNEFPHLKKSVFFLGEITNRKKLFDYYRKSKAFCLTSVRESFGIVLVEAGYFGNYLISSEFPSSKDITRNGRLGKLFKPKDHHALSKIIQNVIDKKIELKETSQKTMRFIRKEFSWCAIVEKLHKQMTKRGGFN